MNIIPYSKQLKTAKELFEHKKTECESVLKELTTLVDEIYDSRKKAVKAIRSYESFLKGLTNRDVKLDKDMAEVISIILPFEECLSFEQHPEKMVKNSDYAAAISALAGMSGATGLVAFATLFGEASTGVSIHALHGAAATKAMLAYLGGGPLAAGGGGIVAGQAVLAAVGPLGWAIAGVFLTKGVIGRIHSKIERKIGYDSNRHQLRLTIESSKRNILGIQISKAEIDKIIDQLSTSSIIDFPKDYTLLDTNQKDTLVDMVNRSKLLANEINKRFIIK